LLSAYQRRKLRLNLLYDILSVNKTSSRTKRAIRYVWEGMTRYSAANKAGIAVRTIYRAFPSGSTNSTTSPLRTPVIGQLPDQTVKLSTGLKSN